MSGYDIDYAADAIIGAGYERAFQRIADAYLEGLKTSRTPEVGLFLALRVIRYERGRAIATSFGHSVSTRLIVRKEQRRFREAGPGWWRS